MTQLSNMIEIPLLFSFISFVYIYQVFNYEGYEVRGDLPSVVRKRKRPDNFHLSSMKPKCIYKETKASFFVFCFKAQRKQIVFLVGSSQRHLHIVSHFMKSQTRSNNILQSPEYSERKTPTILLREFPKQERPGLPVLLL